MSTFLKRENALAASCLRPWILGLGEVREDGRKKKGVEKRTGKEMKILLIIGGYGYHAFCLLA